MDFRLASCRTASQEEADDSYFDAARREKEESCPRHHPISMPAA
jgi:hypothetical protein